MAICYTIFAYVRYYLAQLLGIAFDFHGYFMIEENPRPISPESLPEANTRLVSVVTEKPDPETAHHSSADQLGTLPSSSPADLVNEGAEDDFQIPQFDPDNNSNKVIVQVDIPTQRAAEEALPPLNPPTPPSKPGFTFVFSPSTPHPVPFSKRTLEQTDDQPAPTGSSIPNVPRAENTLSHPDLGRESFPWITSLDTMIQNQSQSFSQEKGLSSPLSLPNNELPVTWATGFRSKEYLMMDNQERPKDSGDSLLAYLTLPDIQQSTRETILTAVIGTQDITTLTLEQKQTAIDSLVRMRTRSPWIPSPQKAQEILAETPSLSQQISQTFAAYNLLWESQVGAVITELKK